LSLSKVEDPYLIPKYQVIIDESLEFSCIILNKPLPATHIIYKNHIRSIKKITISHLLKEVSQLKICSGITDKNINLDNAYSHNIPLKLNLQIDEQPNSMVFNRSRDCLVLCEDTVCDSCIKFTKASKTPKSMNKNIDKPAHKNAPLTKTHPNRVKLALKEKRLECNLLKKQIARMQKEINSNGVAVDKNISQDMVNFMDSNVSNASPFMKLF